MISANHVCAGAIIAVTIKQPAIALPLAFVSHFVMDMLPHYGLAVVGNDVRSRNNNPLFRMVWRTDVVLAVGLFMVWPIALHNIVPWYWIVLGQVLAVSPDFVWVYRFFKELKTGVLGARSRFSKFHKNIQWCERKWGLAIDIGWLLVSIVVLSKLAS